jgi:molybdate transport system substrate-binding protein
MVIKAFSEKTGNEVIAIYGGSGKLLSQMKLSGKGDVYLSASSDFMEKAKKHEIVDPSSEQIVAYLIPAINVQKGNPKNIRSLQDLTREDIELVIANPRFVCVGLYAVEIFEANNLSALIRPRIKSYAESGARTANTIAIGGADAVIGWRVFEHWNTERIQTVLLKPEEVPRISYISIAVSRFSEKRALAEEFLAFVVSPEGKQMFESRGYIVDEEAARRFAPQAHLGGDCALPQGW